MEAGTMSLSTNATCSLVGLFAGMLATIVNEEIKHATTHFNQPQITESYDFIVVGAGSAGSVVASRLSENPAWRVLLLEDGGPSTPLMDVPGHFSVNWGKNVRFFTAEPNPKAYNGKPLIVPRGKVLGGSSIINAMMYVRGNRRDYDRWAALGNEGWDYENVLEYFKKSEKNVDPQLAKDTRHHGTDGPMTVSAYVKDEISQGVLDSFKWLGFEHNDYNGEEQIGVDFCQQSATPTSRQSTSTAFLDPVKHRENLHIRINSRVTKVILDEAKQLAKGVEFLDLDGNKHEVFASKEVVISAGPIESPQILMLSGIGPKEHLQSLNIPVYADLPVGENLQDHPVIFPAVGLKSLNPKLAEGLPAKLREHINYMEHRTGSLTNPPAQTVAYKSFSDDPMEGDIMYISTSTIYGTECYSESDLFTHLGIVVVLMRSNSKGRILLKDSNPLSEPIIELNLLNDPTDAVTLKKALKYIFKIKEAPSLAKLNLTLDTEPLPFCSHLAFGSDDYLDCVLRAYTVSLFHESGSCRMGPKSDTTSVVDSTLRVHGFNNLRVADASIMPILVSGNTNAPTIMIGEKVSDLIKATWNISKNTEL